MFHRGFWTATPNVTDAPDELASLVERLGISYRSSCLARRFSETECADSQALLENAVMFIQKLDHLCYILPMNFRFP